MKQQAEREPLFLSARQTTAAIAGMHQRMHVARKVLLVVAVALVLVGMLFLVYVSSYARADAVAMAAITTMAAIMPGLAVMTLKRGMGRQRDPHGNNGYGLSMKWTDSYRPCHECHSVLLLRQHARACVLCDHNYQEVT